MPAMKPILRMPERLTLPWLILAGAALSLSMLITTDHIEQVTAAQARQQLTADRQTLERALVPQAQRAQAVAQWLANKPALGDLAKRTEAPETQVWLDEAVKTSGMHWAALVDAQGEPQTAVTDEVRTALRQNRAALRAHHSTSAGINIRQGHDTVWLWLHPIEATGGGLAGQVVLGQTLNASWRGNLSGLTRSQLIFLERDRPDGPWVQQGRATPQAAANAWPGKEGPSRQANIHPLTLGGQRWLADTLPMVLNDAYNLEGMALLLDPNVMREPWLDLVGLILPILITAFSLGIAWSAWQGLRLRWGLVGLMRWARASLDSNSVVVPAAKTIRELHRLSADLEALRRHQKDQEAEIRHTAFLDPLTLLPNREQFCTRFKQLQKSAGGKERFGAVILMDIQRFKHINEVLGHHNGDRLLRLVAQRLNDLLTEKHEALARVGGNRFVFHLPQVSPTAAVKRAEAALAALDAPFELDDQTIDLSAQAGVSLYPDNGLDGHDLLTRAEVALYAARHQHQAWLSYSATMDASDPASLTLLSDLKQAISQGELRLFIQPKVDLSTGDVSGGEALMRWKHPKRGMVPPDRFIPFAEQSGFIKQLTLWAVEECAKAWLNLQLGGLDIPLSVNLSTRDLIDKDLPAKLREVVERQGALPQALVLEITESATMDDPESAHRTLCELHEMGFKLSIDDFGTGYSSLAYLKNLPVDELKIDRSFVMNMETDLSDAKIVRSTIDLAHNLGLKVVAEGLESPKAWKLLAGLHCDQAQGYLVSRPIPAEDFLIWARSWRAPNVGDEHLATAFADII
jgi:diguanylate cyclase (GGDEF)-like protein